VAKAVERLIGCGFRRNQVLLYVTPNKRTVSEAMTDEPREYDREYTTYSDRTVRTRIGYSHEKGRVTQFVVQLEYELEGSWRTVVRFDHDEGGAEEIVHDVVEEGLHMDVYRDGEKIRTEQITGPIPSGAAFAHAEEHLAEHRERYISRFEQWHRTDRTDQ